MHKTNFLLGVGIGTAVGSCIGIAINAGKKGPKNVVGRTLKTMGEVADAVSSSMGL